MEYVYIYIYVYYARVPPNLSPSIYLMQITTSLSVK